MKILFFLFLTVLFVSCSQDSKKIKTKDLAHKNTENQKTTNNASKKEKEKAFFVLHNVKNLEFISELYWDFEDLYLNKTSKLKFEKLDNSKKMKYLNGILTFNNEKVFYDKSNGSYDMAYIVAKQPKINDFTPTLIKLYGTGYSAFVLVNIKGEKVLSGHTIFSLELNGPETSEDTIIMTRPKTFCSFKNNQISVKNLVGTCYPHKEDCTSFKVKETNYTISIRNNGTIKKEIKDSSEYTKMCSFDFFQSN